MFELLWFTGNKCLLGTQVPVKICFVWLKGFKCTQSSDFALTKNLLCEHSQIEHTENSHILSEKKSKIAKLDQVTSNWNKVAKTPKTQTPKQQNKAIKALPSDKNANERQIIILFENCIAVIVKL